MFKSSRIFIKIGIVALVAAWLLGLPLQAAESPYVPEPLKPWVEWVKYGHEEQFQCTPAYNDPNRLHCDWPTRLVLEIEAKSGAFRQQWQIQHERWIRLPGDSKLWPREVRVNENPVVILERKGYPHLRLSPGRYEIRGAFSWSRIPEYVSVPPNSALISLQIKGRPIDVPMLDATGRLWLQTKKKPTRKIEDRLHLKSFRLIDDQIPARVTVALSLEVAGTAREVILGPVFAPLKFRPLSLKSPLPARLEADARLRIQVRPGQWQLTLGLRHLGPLETLAFSPPKDGQWPREEIWAFAAQPNLRLVEIENVRAIDPTQTALPKKWHRYPAYAMEAGTKMLFKQIKRGDPHPAPDQLQLQRELWLRFDGSGYTIKDTISGRKHTAWRLEMNSPLVLGRVAVDGREQFITRRSEEDSSSGKSGVELRRGRLKVVADSHYSGDITGMAATGWDNDFQKVQARLHLPPGWRLLYTTGIDHVPQTWLNRWTLLDLFVVLIFSIAIAKLFGWPLATVALAALVLTYHEAGAPRWIWLALLVGVALLRYLPVGRFRRIVRLYQSAAIVVLVVIAIPFAVQQIRMGIYPQLEKPWHTMADRMPSRSVTRGPAADRLSKRTATAPAPQAVTEQMEMVQQAPPKKPALQKSTGLYGSSAKPDRIRQTAQYDPGLRLQTGPGLPQWDWNSINMRWSVPVQPPQRVTLGLIGPKINLLLAFLRVALLALLSLGLLGVRLGRTPGAKPGVKSLSVTVTSFICIGLINIGLIIGTLPGRALAGQPVKVEQVMTNAGAGPIPAPEMLNTLRERLLMPDECFPSCATIGEMALQIDAHTLRIGLGVDTRRSVAVPIPGHVQHWLPAEVQIDGRPVDALLRRDETLYLLVPKGKHLVTLAGRMPDRNRLQLPLPLKPHRVTVQATGWEVKGVHENGVADNQLSFKRIIADKNRLQQVLEAGILPPFLVVERTLRLGLDWRVETRLRRLSPLGAAIVLDIPLLPGERVVSEGVRVRDGRVMVNMGARQGHWQWQSVLEPADKIILQHAPTASWTEIWQVDVSPLFHMATSGIPVILHQKGDRWHPTWHPWPGETVTLAITRPVGVEGQTLTIDRSRLEIRPGRRATDNQLELGIRSSQGGRHTLKLPPEARLQEVRLNGKPMPIRQEGRNVPLPISPGPQNITLKWRDPAGIGTRLQTPAIDLGAQSVNVNIEVHLPRNRWPLFVGGPRMGPAVLFWAVLLVITLAAAGLSRTGLTPLRFHQWLLLGIGISQSHLLSALFIVAWLLALDRRGRVEPPAKESVFNLMQVGIVMLTLLSLVALVFAISQGLLGHPDMSITGNGSNGRLLRWYQDWSASELPQAWVVSIPMLAYRLAMLAWALWISFTLIRLLKWGWQQFGTPAMWRKIPKRKRRRASWLKRGDPAKSRNGIDDSQSRGAGEEQPDENESRQDPSDEASVDTEAGEKDRE